MTIGRFTGRLKQVMTTLPSPGGIVQGDRAQKARSFPEGDVPKQCRIIQA